MKVKLNSLLPSFLLLLLFFPIHGKGEVEYSHQKDVVYGYKDGMALVMNVYSPKMNPNKAGIIVVIAGGMSSNPVHAQYAGNRGDIQNLLKEGYVVFATTHSSQPKYTADEMRYDIPRAVRFIRYNAKKFNIDPHRIGIVGYSSGGHVSLMAGLAPPPISGDSKDPIDQVSSELQAVVAYYPSTDLLNFGAKGKTILEYFHSLDYKIDAAFDFHYWDETSQRFERVESTADKEEYYRNNSPITFVSNDDPPILLVHGDKDKVVPIQQSELLLKKLKENGLISRLYKVNGFGHGFGFRNTSAYDHTEITKWFSRNLLD